MGSKITDELVAAAAAIQAVSAIIIAALTYYLVRATNRYVTPDDASATETERTLERGSS